MGGSKMEVPSAVVVRRDRNEVLWVSRDSSDQETKTAYRKLDLKYHTDKNSSNPEASELSRRLHIHMAFYPIQRRGGNMIVHRISVGVPIKTTISANVLEESLSGTVRVGPLPIGTSVSGKVEKQSAHFFGVTINEEQEEADFSHCYVCCTKQV